MTRRRAWHRMLALAVAVVSAGCTALVGLDFDPSECASPRSPCTGGCVDLDTDASNCGACGQACPASQACRGGTCGAGGSSTVHDGGPDGCDAEGGCASVCDSGETSCDGACVKLTSDIANCGGCGVACGANQVCADSACSPTCGAGQTNCGGSCLDTTSDTQNCGACGEACALPAHGAATCSASQCGVVCDAGFSACGDACVDEQTDPDHCGSCTNACASPVSGAATGSPRCVGAACGVACDAATPTECTLADGSRACVDTKADARFCGGCTTQCGGGKDCVNGACVSACPPGGTSCFGTCTSKQSDPNNCNTCGNVCPALLNGNNHCQSGVCKATCDAGFTSCSIGILGLTACADLQNDETHCGNCSTACTTSQVCTAGQCKPFIVAGGCWECGNGNAFPLCCPLGGKTICTSGAVCPQ